jgi:hypothetical protein
MAEQALDSTSLIVLAAAHGHRITARSLELWRYRGLLPRPVRQPKGRAVWLYPAGSDRQLLRLLHWRARSRTLDAVRVALWVEGFPVELGDVRDSLRSLLNSFAGTVERELGEPGDLSQAIDRRARSIASMRSRAPFPRVVRMTLTERSRAYGYALAIMSGDSDEIERRSADSMLLERMLGLRSGHTDGLAELSPLHNGVIALVPVLSLSDAQTTIAEATEEQYELIRRLARATLLWVPLLVPLIETTIGAKAVPLTSAARDMFRDPPAEVHAVIATSMLVSLTTKAPGQPEIERLLSQMTPGAVDREMLSLITDNARQRGLRALDPHQREHIEDELASAQR